MTDVVYFIRNDDTGTVKIGHSSNVDRRVTALSSAVGCKLTLLRTVGGGQIAEQWYHKRFSDLRIKGEWFTFHPEMLEVDPPELSAAATNNALKRAVEAAGGQVRLAKALGVSQSTLWHWIERTKRGVPAEYVQAIEAATGVPSYELRPDIFPLPADHGLRCKP